MSAPVIEIPEAQEKLKKSKEKEPVVPRKVVPRVKKEPELPPPRISVKQDIVVVEPPPKPAESMLKSEVLTQNIGASKLNAPAEEPIQQSTISQVGDSRAKVTLVQEPTKEELKKKAKEAAKRKKKQSIQLPFIEDINHSDTMQQDRTLKESGEYNYFLLKVAFEFLIFYLALVAVCVYMLLDVGRSRTIYRALGFRIWVWVFLGFMVAIKALCGFFGRKLKSIIKLFWALDLVLSCGFVFGLFYFLQENADGPLRVYSPYVVIYIINLFAAMCAFVLSTFYKSKTRRYNFYIGWAMMTFVTTLTTIALHVGWDSQVTISAGQYVGIAVVMAVHNLYVVLEAYFMVTRRASILREHQSLRAFYSVFTDLTYRFWKDLVGKLKHNFVIKSDKKVAKPDIRLSLSLNKIASESAAETPAEEELTAAGPKIIKK